MAAKFNLSSLMAITMGIAINPYRKKMDRKDSAMALFLDWPIFMGSDSPIKIKLTMLNIVPRIRPFPMGFASSRKNAIPTNIASVIAREQYFFWACLIFSTLTVFVLEYFHDLPVDDHASADNPENRKKAYKDPLDTQPLVDLKADKETESDASGHG